MPGFSLLDDIATVYAQFEAPVLQLDCGAKCAPYNDYGIPFCCDTTHAVPTAYQSEWAYLEKNTDLWHLWAAETEAETAELTAETPDGQVLIACLGHKACQRSFRSITCRAFPFFPYIDRHGEFLGLSYYWHYEDRCWVLSHLDQVDFSYICQFVATYEQIFLDFPQEKANFQYHATQMRRIFGRRKRAIPLLHRNGTAYKITPRNGRLRKVPPTAFRKHEPYKTADLLKFPDEQ